MLKQQLITVLFIISTCTAFAQRFTISGTITDDSGKPIPFASILIRNTTKGSSANGNGNYSINISGGDYELIFKAVGYRQETRKVSLAENVFLNVSLTEASYQLNDVVVRSNGEDPAYSIIRKAISKRKSYLNEVQGYNSDVYLKGLQKLLAAPKKFLGRDIDKIGRKIGLDSNRQGIIYLSESQSKLSFIRPNLYREEMISSKVSGSNTGFSFNRASDIKVNMYQNYQYWNQLSNRPLISPIADNALNFYNYKWLGSTEENGQTINKIQLTPKHSYEPAFSGLIYIMEDSWRIHSFDLQITKTANLKVVDTLKIKEVYLAAGNKTWMPASVKFEFVGSFLSFRFGGYFIAVYSNYQLDPIMNKKDFTETLHIPKDVNHKDAAYWQKERPLPLTTDESNDYQKKAILAAKRESKPYLDSLDHENNKLTPGKILFTGMQHHNRHDHNYYYFDPVVPSFLYNTVEGLAVNYGATYAKQLDSATNKYLRLRLNVRYGFGNHLFHTNAMGSVPVGRFKLDLRAGTGMYDLNSLEPIDALNNTITTLFDRRNLKKLYEKQFGQASLSGRLTGGLLGSLSTEYANRKWHPNTSFYSLGNKDKAFTSNNPLLPEIDQPLFPNNQALIIYAGFSYNFSNKYETYPSGKRYLNFQYPKLELNYTKGLRSVLGSDVDYDLLSANLSKEGIRMGIFGKSSFYIGAGKFLNARQLYFTDYAGFFGNDGFVNRISPNRFLFLDSYLYSTPNQYFEAHMEHNFSGYILNNIPLIRKLKLQEIIDFNYLSTPALKNYYEFAAGVQYLNFRLLYAISYKDGTKAERGFKIGIVLPQHQDSQ